MYYYSEQITQKSSECVNQPKEKPTFDVVDTIDCSIESYNNLQISLINRFGVDVQPIRLENYRPVSVEVEWVEDNNVGVTMVLEDPKTGVTFRYSYNIIRGGHIEQSGNVTIQGVREFEFPYELTNEYLKILIVKIDDILLMAETQYKKQGLLAYSGINFRGIVHRDKHTIWVDPKYKCNAGKFLKLIQADLDDRIANRGIDRETSWEEYASKLEQEDIEHLIKRVCWQNNSV